MKVASSQSAATGGELGDAGKRPRGTAEDPREVYYSTRHMTVQFIPVNGAVCYFLLVYTVYSDLDVDLVDLRPASKPAVIALGRGCADGV